MSGSSVISRSSLRPAHSYGGAGRSIGAYSPRQHILTVEVEDYFQTIACKRIVRRANWFRYERRLEAGTIKTLDLLDEFGAKATFFTLGWVAEAAPELVRLIVERGHEVAARGYYHQSFGEFTRRGFREDVIRARDLLEDVIGQRVIGFRIADGRLRPENLWALPVLQDLGFSYDSSLQPLFWEWSKSHIRRFVQRTRLPGPELWEVPLSSLPLFGMDVPVGGGNYFRQLPPQIMRRAVTRWMQRAPGAVRDVLPHLGAGRRAAAAGGHANARPGPPVPEPAADARDSGVLSLDLQVHQHRGVPAARAGPAGPAGAVTGVQA